jgi:hypothetical protein
MGKMMFPHLGKYGLTEQLELEAGACAGLNSRQFENEKINRMFGG